MVPERVGEGELMDGRMEEGRCGEETREVGLVGDVITSPLVPSNAIP